MKLWPRFSDNYSDVKYFYEKSKESSHIVVSSVLLETEINEMEDANLVAGWQPCVVPNQ
jgi:hypothetical protein